MNERIMETLQDSMNMFNVKKSDIEKAYNEFDLPEISIAETQELTDCGIEMDGPYIENGVIEISGKGEVFSYKKRPVILYIKEQWLSEERIAAGKWDKYHLCYCEHLKERKDLYKRYVMVRRIDGNFYFRALSKEKRNEVLMDYGFRRLDICQGCLRQLNWKNFNAYCAKNGNFWETSAYEKGERQKIVSKFKISEFLDVMQQDILAEIRKARRGKR